MRSEGVNVRKVATRSKEKSQISLVLQPPEGVTVNSGLRDNYSRGKVGDFLRQKIQSGSTLSVVSAYFTIYAFEALKAQLNGIASLRFLFGEPRFLKSLDPEKTDKKAFKIEDDRLHLVNRLEQKRVAKGMREMDHPKGANSLGEANKPAPRQNVPYCSQRNRRRYSW
jgi:hypothetical protein